MTPEQTQPNFDTFVNALGVSPKPQTPIPPLWSRQLQQAYDKQTEAPTEPAAPAGLADQFGPKDDSLFHKGVDLVTGAEQGFGNDIGATLTGNKQVEDASKLADKEQTYLRTVIGLRDKAKEEGEDTAHWDTIINNYKPQGYQQPDLPSTGKVLEDAAGVALDIGSAGTYGAAKTAAMKTGELALKGTPAIVEAGTDVAKAAKNAVVGTAEEQAAKQANKIIDVVSPKMTAKETTEALASRGGTKSGILGTVKVNTDPAVKRIADTVSKYVPDFSPKKTLVENINATKEAVSNLATDLKNKVIESGQDRIYSFKELGSKLKAIEKSPQLVGDIEKTYDKVVGKAMDIARSNGGKVSDLFQARKEFDEYISKVFPDLYSSERLTPMRSAIKDIRNAMTDFTAEHLPEDVGLRDSLTSQHHLMTAVENMSGKAASGAAKEVGTNVFDRATSALKNHPVIGGFGGVAAYEAAKKVPIVGDILP